MKKESLIMLSLLFTTAAVALTFTTTVPKVTPTFAAPPEGVVAVDLALPGGTKWANMNVGAEKPEDFGLYFAWGETDGYEYDTVAYPFGQFRRIQVWRLWLLEEILLPQ